MEPAELEDRSIQLPRGPRRSVQGAGNDQTAELERPISQKDPNNELYPKHRNQLYCMLVVKLVRSCGNCVETQDGFCIGGKNLGFACKKLWQLCGNSGRVLYRWQEFGICFLLGNKSRMQLTLRFHALLLGWIFASRF